MAVRILNVRAEPFWRISAVCYFLYLISRVSLGGLRQGNYGKAA